MRLLTAKAAADYLGIPLRTFYYLVQQGRIARYVMAPRVTRYEQFDLDAFLKTCRRDSIDTASIKNVQVSPSTVALTAKHVDVLDSFRRAGVKIDPKRLQKRG